jgi:hypothetical protein
MFTSPEQFYTGALCQDMKHQQPQAPRTEGKSLWCRLQQHLPQQEIQKTSLTVQASSSSNNDMLKVAIVVQQIITDLSEDVSEKDKIMVITKWPLPS